MSGPYRTAPAATDTSGPDWLEGRRDRPVHVIGAGQTWLVPIDGACSVVDDLLAAMRLARTLGLMGECEYRASEVARRAMRTSAVLASLSGGYMPPWGAAPSAFKGVPVAPDETVKWVDLHVKVSR